MQLRARVHSIPQLDQLLRRLHSYSHYHGVIRHPLGSTQSMFPPYFQVRKLSPREAVFPSVTALLRAPTPSRSCFSAPFPYIAGRDLYMLFLEEQLSFLIMPFLPRGLVKEKCLGSRISSATDLLCGFGQIDSQLWASFILSIK